MKRMLFNATQAEELRVAIVDGQKLVDLDIESASKEQKKSNIYKAVITRIEPSLEAAFVDYGAERHGFLPFKEISRSYFQPGVEASRATIKEALREGQELIVQVDKDERGNKGAAMTTYVSLAGRYLVLMPNNPRGGGVSRRVEGDERAELRDIMDQLQVPSGMSLIARTAAIGRGAEELQWDLNYLMQLWKAIEGASQENVLEKFGSRLLYPEGNLVIRAIRDYFQPDIGEVLIDTDEIFDQARHFMSTVMPGNVNRIKRYRDDVPLFSRFQIEHQIESAYSRQVNLPSGGAIVIDHTEALVSVDVNSGRSTRGADIEETAFKTNLEAAEEVARQLRLRDLGGLIIIDFIDMENQRNQREVENVLRDGLRLDRARVQTGKISKFGLMELSRQRLRPALAETSYIPCPRCSGTGHIRSAESAALHILRILEEEAMKDNTAAVHTQVPVDVATFLLNEKRQDIQAIELRHKVTVLLIPNVHLETPQHSIIRLRHEDLNHDDSHPPSYKMVEVPAEEADKYVPQTAEAKPRQEAAVKWITPQQPAPVVEEKPKVAAPKPEKGFISRILGWFRSEPAPEPEPKPERKPRSSSQRDGRRGGRNNRRDDEQNENRTQRSNRDAKEGREPRNANASARDENQKPREPREPREPRRQRGEPRPERKEQPAPTTADLKEQPSKEAPMEHGEKPVGENGNGGNSRRRGRRGGRRDRNDKTENSGDQAANLATPVTGQENAGQPTTVAAETTAVGTVTAEAIVVQAEETTVRAETSTETTPTSVTAETPVEVVTPVAAAPSAIAAEVEPESVPALEPVSTTLGEDQVAPATIPEAQAVVTDVTAAGVVGAVAAPAPEAIVVEPVVDVEKALESSGLVMIETSGDKAHAWSADNTVETAPVAPRGRQRRQPAAVVANEPLVMVETQRTE